MTTPAAGAPVEIEVKRGLVRAPKPIPFVGPFTLHVDSTLHDQREWRLSFRHDVPFASSKAFRRLSLVRGAVFEVWTDVAGEGELHLSWAVRHLRRGGDRWTVSTFSSRHIPWTGVYEKRAK